MTDPMPDVNAPTLAAWRAHVPASHRDPRLVERTDLIVCDACGTVHQRIALARAQVAHCLRCDGLLGRGHVVQAQGLVAFALGALLLLIIGNLSPIVSLDLGGVQNQVTLPQAVRDTWSAGQPLVAVLAAVTAMVFPFALTLLRLYVLLPLSAGRLPSGFVPAMRALSFATHWSMVEVFLMGTLVSVVRTAGLASVTPGMGLIAYAALTLLLTSISAAGMHTIWKMGSELGCE